VAGSIFLDLYLPSTDRSFLKRKSIQGNGSCSSISLIKLFSMSLFCLLFSGRKILGANLKQLWFILLVPNLVVECFDIKFSAPKCESCFDFGTFYVSQFAFFPFLSITLHSFDTLAFGSLLIDVFAVC
jgi:hypothetical protein